MLKEQLAELKIGQLKLFRRKEKKRSDKNEQIL